MRSSLAAHLEEGWLPPVKAPGPRTGLWLPARLKGRARRRTVSKMILACGAEKGRRLPALGFPPPSKDTDHRSHFCSLLCYPWAQVPIFVANRWWLTGLYSLFMLGVAAVEAVSRPAQTYAGMLPQVGAACSGEWVGGGVLLRRSAAWHHLCGQAGGGVLLYAPAAAPARAR